MKRYVIYSALVGKYDNILQPVVIDNRFDYILFSNDIKSDHVGIWKVKSINYQNRDSTRICRYIKTHPEELLDDYEVSVWIDSNVSILSDIIYRRVIELDEQNIPISSMWHPVRKCIYAEAFATVNMMVEHESVVVNWCHKLKKEGFPQNIGLCETGVMYRKHHMTCVQDTDTLWWNCIDKYSRRDQLSFNYVLWKLGVPCHYFFGKGKNARNTEDLQVIRHQDIQHNHCPIRRNEAWLMRHCWKHKEETEKVERIYYNLYSWPSPHFWIGLVGQYYRLCDRIKRI